MLDDDVERFIFLLLEDGLIPSRRFPNPLHPRKVRDGIEQIALRAGDYAEIFVVHIVVEL